MNVYILRGVCVGVGGMNTGQGSRGEGITRLSSLAWIAQLMAFISTRGGIKNVVGELPYCLLSHTSISPPALPTPLPHPQDAPRLD